MHSGAQKNEGTLTRQEILQSAAEFDPESIRYLSFDRRQLINIDSLREFKNLVHLNLSYNSICVLDPLKEVNTLNFLNLASNKITNIGKPLSLTVVMLARWPLVL